MLYIGWRSKIAANRRSGLPGIGLFLGDRGGDGVGGGWVHHVDAGHRGCCGDRDRVCVSAGRDGAGEQKIDRVRGGRAILPGAPRFFALRRSIR